MSLYGAFAVGNHFSELDLPYDDGQGTILTSAQRRAAALSNLYGNVETVTTDALTTTSSVGTLTTPATSAVVEHGDGAFHVSRFTFTAFPVGTTVDSVNLAVGAKFYTFPAGTIGVESVMIRGALTGAGATKTDTPEVGVGTVIASGAVATLATSTFENLVDGGAAGMTGDADTVAPDINGTAFQKGNLSTVRPIIETTGGLSHDIFLNVADGWAATSAGVLTFTGVITVRWVKMS